MSASVFRLVVLKFWLNAVCTRLELFIDKLFWTLKLSNTQLDFIFTSKSQSLPPLHRIYYWYAHIQDTFPSCCTLLQLFFCLNLTHIVIFHLLYFTTRVRLKKNPAEVTNTSLEITAVCWWVVLKRFPLWELFRTWHIQDWFGNKILQLIAITEFHLTKTKKPIPLLSCKKKILPPKDMGNNKGLPTTLLKSSSWSQLTNTFRTFYILTISSVSQAI